MTLLEDLLALEHDGWKSLTRGDRTFYSDLVTEATRVVFPDPVGVIDGGQMVAAIDAANPWARYEIDQPQVVELGPQAAILIYHVTAQRPGQPEYHAWISSGYQRNDTGEWHFAFHQHTPVDA